MRRGLTTLAAGMLLAAVDPAQGAPADAPPDDYRRSMGNRRPDATIASRAVQGLTRPGLDPQPSSVDPAKRQDAYGYGPYAPDGYPCYDPYYPPYFWPPLYPPPLYLPAETMYGPQAIKRFMGIYPGSFTRPVDRAVVPNGARQARRKAPPQRGTNAEAVALGRKFIGFGDARFAEQDYAQAYVRYKKAAQSAPRLAEAHFRQAWALVASGRYELAAAALKRGLQLDPGWPASDFRLDELYGPNRAAKTAHIDALAAAAGDEPHNADLLFLIGTFLFFDGQPHRARVFFEKAADLATGVGAHLGGFLAQLKKREL